MSEKVGINRSGEVGAQRQAAAPAIEDERESQVASESINQTDGNQVEDRRGHAPEGAKAPKGTTKRLMGYILRYRWQCVVIIIGILICAVTQSLPSFVLQPLVDNCIMPFIHAEKPDWGPLIHMTIVVGSIYALGMVASFVWNYMVVGVEQGVLKTIRNEMFDHQQTLPIRYFDTHEHGDMMSRYTNDTDTLRQMISQALPQLLISGSSVVAVVFAMLWLSVPFTIFTLAFVAIMLLVVKGS